MLHHHSKAEDNNNLSQAKDSKNHSQVQDIQKFKHQVLIFKSKKGIDNLLQTLLNQIRTMDNIQIIFQRLLNKQKKMQMQERKRKIMNQLIPEVNVTANTNGSGGMVNQASSVRMKLLCQDLRTNLNVKERNHIHQNGMIDTRVASICA